MKRYMTILTIVGVFAALLVASAMPAVALSPAEESCSSTSGATFVKEGSRTDCIPPPVITSTSPGNPQSENAAAPKTVKVQDETQQGPGAGGGNLEKKVTTTTTVTCLKG